MLRLFLIVCKVSLREKTELMGFTLYLLRFTCLLMLMGEWEMQNPNTKGLTIWTLIFGV
jgi:hypothetical protein